jgi:hypothetical protein
MSNQANVRLPAIVIAATATNLYKFEFFITNEKFPYYVQRNGSFWGIRQTLIDSCARPAIWQKPQDIIYKRMGCPSVG